MHFSQERILYALKLTFLFLLFPISAGVLIVLFHPSATVSILIQAFFFLLSLFFTLKASKKFFGNIEPLGFRQPKFPPLEKLLWFIPILILEILPLFFGLRQELSGWTTFSIFLFSIAVGLSEEIFFRGLLLKILIPQGLSKSLFQGALLFSFSHIANLFIGALWLPTLLQMVFAFFFALCTLELRLLTGSLYLGILWHIFHNYTALLTLQKPGQGFLMLPVLQITLLIFFAHFLWKFLPKNTSEENLS